MKLSKFDLKCVRVTDIFGSVYEGYCVYNNKDYNESEYGKREESLQILNFIFYKSIIKSVESLESVNTPYGHFSNKYGNLEKEIVEEGKIFVEDIVDYEDDIHVYRVLLYIEDHLDKINDYKDDFINMLKSLQKYNKNKDVLNEVDKLLKML